MTEGSGGEDVVVAGEAVGEKGGWRDFVDGAAASGGMLLLTCMVDVGGSTCCAVVVRVRCAAATARMGSKNGGGSRVMGVRSSNTERSSERLILDVYVAV